MLNNILLYSLTFSPLFCYYEVEVFERLAPRLIVIFKKEVGSCLDPSNSSSSSNFYLNEHAQKIILTLMSVSIRASIQRETIFGLASSIFSSILPNRVTWEVQLVIIITFKYCLLLS